MALTNQGSQAYLSLPSSCFGESYSKAQQQGSPQSLGFREDERDSAGNRPSGRGKRYLTRANESPHPVTDGGDGRENLGQVDGAQGVLIQPE